MSNAQFWFLCYILFMIVSNTEQSKELQGQYGVFGIIALMLSMWFSFFGKEEN